MLSAEATLLEVLVFGMSTGGLGDKQSTRRPPLLSNRGALGGQLVDSAAVLPQPIRCSSRGVETFSFAGPSSVLILVEEKKAVIGTRGCKHRLKKKRNLVHQ